MHPGLAVMGGLAGVVLAVVLAVAPGAGARAGAATDRRAGPDAVTVGVLVALLALAAIAYLSVPDTEALVLVGAALVAPTIAALAGWVRLPPRAALGLAAGGVVVIGLATWSGATAGWTPAGWWVAKVGLVAVGAAAVVAVGRGLRSSARARRPR